MPKYFSSRSRKRAFYPYGRWPRRTRSPLTYEALSERCGLVDLSDRGRLALTGADCKELLQGQVTNDVEALEPGTGCYAAFLSHKGKMQGDLRILDTGEELLLDCERLVLQPLFTMINALQARRRRRAAQAHAADAACSL